MAWTCDFTPLDSSSVGQITARWNTGLSDEFNYSIVLDISKTAQVTAFLNEAKARQARFATFQTDWKTRAASLKTQAETFLNS